MVAKNCTFWFHIWQHWDIHRLDFLLEFESFASLRDISSLSPKSVNWDKLTVLYILFLKGFLPEHILIGFTQCEESDSLDSLSKGLRHLHHDRHSSFKVFLTPCTMYIIISIIISIIINFIPRLSTALPLQPRTRWTKTTQGVNSMQMEIWKSNSFWLKKDVIVFFLFYGTLPRNFYLGKADYIFTLTFAAEVCLKVHSPHRILTFTSSNSFETFFELELRRGVSLGKSILPILTSVTDLQLHTSLPQTFAL